MPVSRFAADAAELAGLVPGPEQLHHRVRLADRHHEPVRQVVRIGFHPLPAAQHLDQRPGFLRAAIVGFQVDRLAAAPRRPSAARPIQASTTPRLNHAAGSSGRQLRELLECLAGVAELAGGEVGAIRAWRSGGRRTSCGPLREAGSRRRTPPSNWAANSGSAGLEVHGAFQRGAGGHGPVEHRLELVNLEVDVGERVVRLRVVTLGGLAVEEQAPRSASPSFSRNWPAEEVGHAEVRVELQCLPDRLLGLLAVWPEL